MFVDRGEGLCGLSPFFVLFKFFEGYMKKFYLLAVIALCGCTSAGRAQFDGFGSDFTVTVYSGGTAVRTFESSGKVLAETESDGWYFSDAKTGKLVRVSGTVVIEQK